MHVNMHIITRLTNDIRSYIPYRKIHIRTTFYAGNFVTTLELKNLDNVTILSQGCDNYKQSVMLNS